MHKNIAIISGIGGVAAAGLLVAGIANAHGILGGGFSPDTMAEKLAAKLGVPTEKVTTALQEVRVEQENSRLDTLVSEGKLTVDQKTAVQKKLQEQESTRKTKAELDAMSASERKAYFDAERASMKAWADSQGIDLRLVMGGGPGGHGHRGENSPR